MSKIRVVHVLHSFGTGGLEKGIATLVRNSSREFEHVIVCMSTSGESERLLPPNTRIIELQKSPGNSLTFLLKLSRVIKALQPHVIHTRNWGGMDGIMAARFAGCRTIIHGEHGWEVFDPIGDNRKRVLTRRFLSGFVKEYTCVSRQIQGWLHKTIRIKKPITQIYNGVDIDLYSPNSAGQSIRRRVGVPLDAFVIGWVGRLDPIKDHPTLFRAFEIVRQKAPNTVLLIIGDGPERSQLQKEAPEGVSFLGSRPDVPELLRTFDVFVLPSKNEGISNTILEAMATAIPVVATKVGGNPELVEAGSTGFLVKPGDFESMASALLNYYENPALRARHGKAGRARVMKHFGITQMVQSYESVYRRVAYLP
jgi:sugar transferase (PEP-CTERM/EpsH1 system associated)